MKQKFAEFLFKRIGVKIDEMHNISSHEEMTAIMEDLDDYLGTLKEIVMEVMKP